MSDQRELKKLFHRLIMQEVGALHFSFLCIVEEYLGPHPDPWGKSQTKGVLKARAVVRPKHKKVKHGGESVELKNLWDVPVSWYTMGGFLYRFPLKKGDVVLVTVSEKALDHLIVNRDAAHPKIKQICRLRDAIVMPFGVRMDQDPYTPNEALDSLYIAKVDDDGKPISKFMMKPDGEIKFVCPKFTVVCPDMNLVDKDVPEDEKWASRLGDHDNCTDNGGVPDAMIEGSPACRIADESSYKAGLTEPVDSESTEPSTEQPQPPDDAGNPRPSTDETEETELEEGGE